MAPPHPTKCRIFHLGPFMVPLMMVLIINQTEPCEGFGSVRAANQDDAWNNNKQDRGLGVVDGTFAGHRVTQESYDSATHRESHGSPGTTFKAEEEARRPSTRTSENSGLGRTDGRFPALDQPHQTSSGDHANVNSGHAPDWQARTSGSPKGSIDIKMKKKDGSSHDLVVRTSNGTYPAVRELPKGSETIKKDKLIVKYDPTSGHFYYPYYLKNHVVYLSVQPPVGIVVHTLSKNYEEKKIGDETIFSHDGVYLEQVEVDGKPAYKVVSPKGV